MGKTCGSSCESKKSTCGSKNAAVAQQDVAIATSLGRIKNKILVMSGKGGVGKSTVSTNLALGLAERGYKVGLMDVDLHGPDICRMLNLTARLSDMEKSGGLVPPMSYGKNLKVISLEYMMENRDDPIIWRGPLKIQAIRQFIADLDWGELDYLIIDAPPGTGDEPLTVANTIKDAQALVVTTPQEVALADVRKSLNFCKHVKMKVLGLVENMSGLVCPHCNKTVDLFKSGGGRKTADDFKVPFLGSIPLDPKVVLGGDSGNPYLVSQAESPAIQAFKNLVDNVEKSRATSVSLASVTKECGCGSGGCDPATCDC
ncbi:MAG: Mrp/NBP35 family ATP-binding protein [Proteobacteria bacterium]|nr:Mrp/NBP35 family ATP-binding protein [Pseudomonadota bacterium]MBU1736657.1 Mrp/NBP35 family ATP-binding protein [Pseudomonadota bacterium]